MQTIFDFLYLNFKFKEGSPRSPSEAGFAVEAGFTLLELIIVVGIIGLLSVVIAQVFFTTMKTNTKVELGKEVKQNGEYAMDAIIRMLQSAVSIEGTCTDIAVTEKPILSSLTIVDPYGSSITLRCEDVGSPSVARIASMSGNVSEYLTTSDVTLVSSGGDGSCTASPLQFTCTSIGGKASSVGVSFRLRQKNIAQSVAESADSRFQSSVTLRN